MRSLTMLALGTILVSAAACAESSKLPEGEQVAVPLPSIGDLDIVEDLPLDVASGSSFVTSEDGVLTVVAEESIDVTPTITTVGQSVATDGTTVVAYDIGPSDAVIAEPMILDVRLVDFESGDAVAAFHTPIGSDVEQVELDRIQYVADAARVVAEISDVGTVQLVVVPAEASGDAALVTTVDGTVGDNGQVVLELLRDEATSIVDAWLDPRQPDGDRSDPIRGRTTDEQRAIFAMPCEVEGDHAIATTVTLAGSPDTELFASALVGELPDDLLIARSERATVDCIEFSPDEPDEGLWSPARCTLGACPADFPEIPVEIDPSGSSLSFDVAPVFEWVQSSGRESAVVGFGGEFGWRVIGGVIECRFDSSVIVGPFDTISIVEVPAANNSCTSSSGEIPFPYVPTLEGTRMVHDATTLVNTMNFVLSGAVPPTEPTGGDAELIVESSGNRATNGDVTFGVVPGSRDGSVPPDGWTAASWVTDAFR